MTTTRLVVPSVFVYVCTSKVGHCCFWASYISLLLFLEGGGGGGGGGGGEGGVEGGGERAVC